VSTGNIADDLDPESETLRRPYGRTGHGGTVLGFPMPNPSGYVGYKIQPSAPSSSLKFDSVGRLGGITASTVETTAITKDESFGTPAVSVATFLTREPTSKIITDGFPPPAKVFATSSGMRTTTSIRSSDSGGFPI
jgi:hypothetical protein